MKGLSIPNASSANATLLLALLLLVTTSPSFVQHCVARRESHHRPPPAGRHHPPPPAPVMPPPSPPPLLSTFSVLDYGAVGDGTTDDTKAFATAWSSACAAGASTVLVPVSYVFLVGPITFAGDSCVSNMIFQAVRVFQSSNITVTGITIRNSPRFHLTFDTCRGVEVHDVAVSSPGDSPNTDGIHLAGSVGVSIHHTTIACGDDCISIQDGCSDVFIRSVHCGPGHGISIGGLGKGGASAAVSDITVQDVTLNQTMTGVRIKTWQGGSGSVKNVRFSGVRVSAVKTPIVIDQYYCDHTTCANQTSAVTVAGVAYQGVAGTYTERPVYLACADAAPCAGIHLADIQLAPVDDGGYHLHGPFCWKVYGDEVRPVEPPVNCLLAGAP